MRYQRCKWHSDPNNLGAIVYAQYKNSENAGKSNSKYVHNGTVENQRSIWQDDLEGVHSASKMSI